MASLTRIQQLASIIAKNTETVETYLQAHNLPTPSLDEDATWTIPIADDAVDVKKAHTTVIDACSELQALMTGPKELLRYPYTYYVSIKAILRFNLDTAFPVGSSATFAAMAQHSGLSVRNTTRIVRHAILNHRFFREETPGVVTHSALTAMLAADPHARNMLVVEFDEFWPAAVKTVDALDKWLNSEEANQTGFSLANNTSKSMYDIFAADPVRAERFARYFTGADEPPHLLLDNYAWGDKQLVIDVGGSHGSVAIAVAKRFPGVSCVVQDLPSTVAEGEARLPEEMRGRVRFMAHDFFTPQPLAADVYYFRSIFHNWADKYCVQILRNLIPALKPGARVVIQEQILPSLDTLSTVDARNAVNMDICMLMLLNAHQREMHEWAELFHRADTRFHYLGPRRPEGAMRWIIEAEWRG